MANLIDFDDANTQSIPVIFQNAMFGRLRV
jgi:hypothetical protein